MMMRLDCYQAKRLLACNQDAKLVRKMIIKYNTNACMCMHVYACVCECVFVCMYSWNYYDIWELSRWLLWLLATETCAEIDAQHFISQEKREYGNLLINLWQCVEALHSRGEVGARLKSKLHLPVFALAWSAVDSVRSFCSRGHRRCTDSVQCRRVATAALRWRHNSHTRVPLQEEERGINIYRVWQREKLT